MQAGMKPRIKQESQTRNSQSTAGQQSNVFFMSRPPMVVFQVILSRYLLRKGIRAFLFGAFRHLFHRLFTCVFLAQIFLANVTPIHELLKICKTPPKIGRNPGFQSLLALKNCEHIRARRAKLRPES